jgi:hypothetical protein
MSAAVRLRPALLNWGRLLISVASERHAGLSNPQICLILVLDLISRPGNRAEKNSIISRITAAGTREANNISSTRLEPKKVRDALMILSTTPTDYKNVFALLLQLLVGYRHGLKLPTHMPAANTQIDDSRASGLALQCHVCLRLDRWIDPMTHLSHPALTRRHFLSTSAAALVASALPSAAPAQGASFAGGRSAIRECRRAFSIATRKGYAKS